MRKKIGITIIILLIIAVVALLAYELYTDTFDSENLFKIVLVIASLLLSLAKLLGGSQKRSSLEFYRKQYADMLENAFADDPKSLKQLLGAVRYYNENKFEKAITILDGMKKLCKSSAEIRAVGLFTALCYIDSNRFAEAEKELKALIIRGLGNALIYNDLGFVCIKLGKSEDAYEALETAAALDPENSAATYANIANLYFDEYNLSAAEDYALKALENNPKQYQAASLLAIIYAINEDRTKSEKYFHIAVSSGQKADALKQAIADYTLSTSEREEE